MNIAICDDEERYRKIISDFLERHENRDLFEINEFETAEELLEYSSENRKVDIAFLDIEMPGRNGVEAAKMLKQKNEDIMIIFITAYARYISETFRLGAFQFLLKPINEKDLETDFERALKGYNRKHKKYTVSKKGFVRVPEVREIYYIEAYARRLTVHTANDKYDFPGKLSDEYEKLRSEGFSRIHQGYLVNLEKISGISGKEVTLKNGEVLPVSRNFKKAFLKDLGGYLE